MNVQRRKHPVLSRGSGDFDENLLFCVALFVSSSAGNKGRIGDSDVVVLVFVHVRRC